MNFFMNILSQETSPDLDFGLNITITL